MRAFLLAYRATLREAILQPSMKCDFFSLTDTGRVRANNEDTIAVRPEMGLVALADGMGGYNAGEVASALATQTLLERFTAVTHSHRGYLRMKPLLIDAIHCANRAVFEAASSNPAHRGMGTTLVTAVFRRSRVTIGHVGDSRAYRLRRGHLVRLTRDHSLIQEQLDAGLIDHDAAMISEQRNLVTRAVGVAARVDVEISEHDVQPGDTYLFCSDGLNDMLSDTEMGGILMQFGSLEQAGHELLRQANAAGGRDNISLILVHCPLTSVSRWPIATMLIP